MRKVPELTIFFWIIKLLTTGMGETASDFLVRMIDPPIAVGIGAIGLLASLVLQFRIKRYNAFAYWFTVSMVAIFGTMIADVLHVGLGVPYIVSTLGFSITLAIIFASWYKIEKTLSIHSITTTRRELFYWATVMATFALGTALGDMTATTLKMGYLDSGILFAALFIIPAVMYFEFKLSEVLTFWFAYITTRPLGASFADWIGRSKELGGVGFGTGEISLVLVVLIILFVGYLAITKKDVKYK
ncbi:MAG: COG4705 family protein [Nitrosotalea sp.]